MDGVTSVLQDKLKSLHNITALQLMFAINCIAPVYLLIGKPSPSPPFMLSSSSLPFSLSPSPLGLLITGEGVSAVYFIIRHPDVILNLLAFSSASAIGQLFIFTTITEFGPLTCAVFTTTRKFFTILVSVIIFGNALLQRQWVAVVLVFIGLSIDAYIGSRKKINSNSNEPKQSQVA